MTVIRTAMVKSGKRKTFPGKRKLFLQGGEKKQTNRRKMKEKKKKKT